MDYVNPFSAMGGDSTIESPFLRAMDRGNRQNLAKPFIDMALQNQQMDMQKKQMENSEFASPLAQQLRQQTKQTGLVEQQQKARVLPWTTDEEITKAKRNIELNPAITDKMRAEAEQAAIKARGGPAEDFFNEVGQMYKEIKAQPEAMQQSYAKAYIDQFKERHPGAKVPAFMNQYDPVQWDVAALVSIKNAEHKRKMDEQAAKDAEHLKRTNIESGDRRYIADTAAESRVTAASARVGKLSEAKTDEAKYQIGLTILNNPESTPEEKAIAAKAMQMHIRKRAAAEASKDIASINDGGATLKKKIKEYEDFSGVTEALKGSTPVKDSNTPKTITTKDGKTYEVIGVNPDGSKRIRDPKTGKTGTIK